MALLIWPTSPPPIHPSGMQDDDPTAIVSYAGTGYSQRVSRTGRKLRRYQLAYRTTKTLRDVIQAFCESVRGPGVSFLFKDLDDYARTGISVSPASDGTTATFLLPTTGAYAGDYPINDAATLKLYRAGVLNAGGFSLVPDARSITTATVPAGGGAAMTADYHYRRRVMLRDYPAWVHAPYGVWSTSIELLEVGSS